MGETSKAKARRLREGWFAKYAPEDKIGLDIGCQHDPLNRTYRRWDLIFEDGDAEQLDGLDNNMFRTVYAYHVLEHIENPITAIKNWLRVVKPGGHLIIGVPHRDLYEKKQAPPSNWNHDHKWFWLPENHEPKNKTLSFKDTVRAAINSDGEIVEFKVCDEGYTWDIPQDQHAGGEYTIECVVRKL